MLVPAYPTPDGWTGSGDDPEFTTTLRGRRGVNVNTSGNKASDHDWRRNAPSSFDDFDLGDLGSDE